MRNPALDAWGDYDRDDPYPLFAQVQEDDPVHEVMLADGPPRACPVPPLPGICSASTRPTTPGCAG